MKDLALMSISKSLISKASTIRVELCNLSRLFQKNVLQVFLQGNQVVWTYLLQLLDFWVEHKTILNDLLEVEVLTAFAKS
jgi:hypothetical protein